MDKYWWLGGYVSDYSSWSEEEKSGRLYFLFAFFGPLFLIGLLEIELAEWLRPSVLGDKISVVTAVLFAASCTLRISRPIAYWLWPKTVRIADEKAFARMRAKTPGQKEKDMEGLLIFTAVTLAFGVGREAVRHYWNF